MVRASSPRSVWIRRRAGRGFTYRDADGRRISSEEDLERIRALVIPPAWRNVRIAASPRSRIQARGVDVAGRTQYIYHAAWRQRQDARKFRRALELADRLATVRRRVTADLRGARGPRLQALAAGVRLVDRLGMRVGGRRYARQYGTFGVTTLQRRHLTLDGDRITFDFPGKSGLRWSLELTDADLARYLRSLPQGAPTGHALGYDDEQGFSTVGASALNSYLRECAGMGVSAKDLRTWRATVLAARALARSLEAGAGPDVAWRAAVGKAAAWLHNTPAVARSSYVDPALLTAYRAGRAVPPASRSERAVTRLLRDG
ncbi:DNA topoisomerase IB [Sinomonas mesophila]|uniref:DNA topoisomerase IB n=1 Tax=Sinomonas mesophila TaxID=1531955 RepID=UPI000986BBC4|nr:DNA topoisomerase IB [Sinomonas mesophila]